MSADPVYPQVANVDTKEPAQETDNESKGLLATMGQKLSDEFVQARIKLCMPLWTFVEPEMERLMKEPKGLAILEEMKTGKTRRMIMPISLKDRPDLAKLWTQSESIKGWLKIKIKKRFGFYVEYIAYDWTFCECGCAGRGCRCCDCWYVMCFKPANATLNLHVHLELADWRKDEVEE